MAPNPSTKVPRSNVPKYSDEVLLLPLRIRVSLRLALGQLACVSQDPKSPPIEMPAKSSNLKPTQCVDGYIWTVFMRRLFVGLFFATLLITACGPEGTPEPPIDTDNLDAFVSEGEAILTEVNGREVSLLLTQEQGLDTKGVVVTLVNLGSTYLIETADPDGRFLPAVQIESRVDEPTQEIRIPQIQASSEWSIRFAGTANLRLIKARFMGTTTLESFQSFITRKTLGTGVNILMQVPESLENFQQIDVYRTPGTMTFLALGHGSSQPSEIRFAAVSLMVETLNSVEVTSLLEKVQTLRDGIIVADAEPSIPVLVTYSDLGETPVCSEDEVLVFREEEGATVAECQPAPWLSTELVPTATEKPEETGPTPTPTLPPPTPTPVPVIYTETFPMVDALILGTCPKSVHDLYTINAPDGNTYRTWHPLTANLDPANPTSATCTFAHEHGDPPHPNAPLPYFGYAAYHGSQADVIRQHEGYKVFTHKQGQRNGWDSAELINVNPDIDTQFWVHQGSWSLSRLSDKYHDVGFWSRDAGGRVTEVYYLANTGDLTDKCGGQATSGSKRMVASECDYVNELWDFGGRVGNVWSATVEIAVVNPMNHIRGNPNFLESIELISNSDEICGVNFFPCDFKLPFGHQNSIWLGNMRMLLNPGWQWSNAGGAETFCTDVTGKRAADGLCNAQTRGYIVQRVAKINFFGGNSGAWDRTFDGIGDSLRLPVGAPGGN